ncbi:TetR family transcriptional regulator [Actinomycetota bacterium]|nr:TetR family transcriptional regulator [Actinomycetota bacterium]
MTRAPLTPAAIVAEAAALADESGLDAVTLSAVARRLGVQTPSLYSHVRDHAALLDGITALALADLAERIAAAIAGRAGRHALEGFADAHRAFAREAPGRWQSLQRRAGPTAVASGAARTVVTLTDAVLRGYDLPETERVHAIRLMGAAINGFLTLERVGSFDHSQPPPEESWRRAVTALDSLLRAWPTDPITSQDRTPS